MKNWSCCIAVCCLLLAPLAQAKADPEVINNIRDQGLNGSTAYVDSFDHAIAEGYPRGTPMKSGSGSGRVA